MLGTVPCACSPSVYLLWRNNPSSHFINKNKTFWLLETALPALPQNRQGSGFRHLANRVGAMLPLTLAGRGVGLETTHCVCRELFIPLGRRHTVPPLCDGQEDLGQDWAQVTGMPHGARHQVRTWRSDDSSALSSILSGSVGRKNRDFR